MKTLFLILAILSSSAHAAEEGSAFYCHGISGSEGKTMYAKSVNQRAPRDGEKTKFLFVIRDGSETLFSGYVTAELEDVMLSFHSSGSPKMNAMIYLDEYDQTWVTLGRSRMQFDCASKE